MPRILTDDQVMFICNEGLPPPNLQNKFIARENPKLQLSGQKMPRKTQARPEQLYYMMNALHRIDDNESPMSILKDIRSQTKIDDYVNFRGRGSTSAREINSIEPRFPKGLSPAARQKFLYSIGRAAVLTTDAVDEGILNDLLDSELRVEIPRAAAQALRGETQRTRSELIDDIIRQTYETAGIDPDRPGVFQSLYDPDNQRPQLTAENIATLQSQATGQRVGSLRARPGADPAVIAAAREVFAVPVQEVQGAFVQRVGSSTSSETPEIIRQAREIPMPSGSSSSASKE